MKPYFLLCLILFFSSCVETPEVATSKEIIAKEKIKENQTETRIAQEEYLKLQSRRDRE